MRVIAKQASSAMLQTVLKITFVCLVSEHFDAMAMWQVIFELTSVLVVDIPLFQCPSSVPHAILPLTAVFRPILVVSLQAHPMPASISHFAFIDRQGTPTLHLNHSTD